MYSPCGTPFKKWHVQKNITKFPKFRSCDILVFKDHIDFISHLYEAKDDYYHQIILHLVQSTYSLLLAKFKQKFIVHTNMNNKQTFSSIHKGKVTLPTYMHSGSKYETFALQRHGNTINLCRTNIIEGATNKEYLQYFSETSFQQTLR